jgi:putative endonuclease
MLSYSVYILTNKPFGTLYVGVTSDLAGRTWQHRNKVMPGFTARYGLDRLVWFEQHDSIEAAIGREKQIKRWKRAWKIRLIEATNPDWHDLFPGLSP